MTAASGSPPPATNAQPDVPAPVVAEEVVITQVEDGFRALIRFSRGSVYDVDLGDAMRACKEGLAEADGDVRAGISPSGERQHALGLHLFEAIGARCSEEWQRVEFAGEPLGRIEVEGDAAFHGLPWELLHHEEFPRSLGVPLVRRLKGQRRVVASPPLASELRILIVTARPGGLADVDQRAIVGPLLREDRWGQHTPPRIEVLRSGSYSRLGERLLRREREGRPYQVVHFDMHGRLNEENEAEVIFEHFVPRHDGYAKIGPDPHSAASLARLLTRYGVQVAIFNSCDSASSEGDGEAANIAFQLVKHGVPAAVGMRRPLSVGGGSRFVAELYEQLANNAHGLQPLSDAVMRARWKMASAARLGEVRFDESSLPVLYIGSTPFLKVDAPDGATVASWHRRRKREHEMIELIARSGLFPIVGRDFDERFVRSLLFEVSHVVRPRTAAAMFPTDAPVRVVVVTGMTGVGKSTLLRDLVRHWEMVNFVDAAVLLDCAEIRFEGASEAAAQEAIDDWIRSSVVQAGLDAPNDELSLSVVLRRAGEALLVVDHLEAVVDPKLKALISERIRSVCAGRNWVLAASTTSPSWITSRFEEFRMRALDPRSAVRLVTQALGRAPNSAETEALLRMSGRHPQVLTDLVRYCQRTGQGSSELEDRIGQEALLRGSVCDVLNDLSSPDYVVAFAAITDLEVEVERALLEEYLESALSAIEGTVAEGAASTLVEELIGAGLLERLDILVGGRRVPAVHLHPGLRIRALELLEQHADESERADDHSSVTALVDALEGASTRYEMGSVMAEGRLDWGSATQIRLAAEGEAGKQATLY